MIGVWCYTVILTYLGLVVSFIGMGLAVLYATGEVSTILLAVVCLLFAGFCDMFDGRIARTKKDRTEFEKQFGIQIDSLCDCVCFGVLPAVIGFCLGGNRVLALISGASLVLAGIVRLAYFNVVEMERRSDPDNDDHDYCGLPITMSALISPVLFCFYTILGENFATIYQTVMICVALCYILKIKIKKPTGKSFTALVIAGFVTLAALVILN